MGGGSDFDPVIEAVTGDPDDLPRGIKNGDIGTPQFGYMGIQHEEGYFFFPVHTQRLKPVSPL